jgi:hypothetical protein
VDGAQHDEWYDYDTNTILQGSASQLTDIVADDTFRAEVSVLGSTRMRRRWAAA